MHKLFKKDCLSSLFFYFYLIFKTILKPQIMKKITLFFWLTANLLTVLKVRVAHVAPIV